MSKLIYADFPRIFKSKFLYIIFAVAAVMGAGNVFFAYADSTGAEGELFVLAANNYVMFLSMMLPILSGGLSILLIANEFSSGVIRNKLVMGHSRGSIFAAWTIIYTITTILIFFVYTGVYFIALLAAGADFSLVQAGTVLANLGIILLFVLKFQCFALLVASIYPDAKTAVICYVFNSVAMMLPMLVQESAGDGTAMKVFSKIFLSSFEFSFMSKPNDPLVTVACIVGLGALYLILGKLYFEKKDLK